MFDNILETENAFKTIKNGMLEKIDTLGLFQRGLSMVLDKNVKFGHKFLFRKRRQKNVFDNILETKNAFKTIKTRS